MSESESDLENSPPRKLKKIHYDQKYSKLWEKDKDYAGWITVSNKGNQYFHCKACGCDLKCGGGKFILNKHANSSKHINNVKGLFVSIYLYVELVTGITSLLLLSLINTVFIKCYNIILFFRYSTSTIYYL